MCVLCLRAFVCVCVCVCVSTGKKFVPKEQERTVVNEDDEAVETEWDEILMAASEEELVDLAGESAV